MQRFLIVVLGLSCLMTQNETAAKDTRSGPIKALLVTGGCCHDYERQKAILTKGTASRADIVWTIVHQGGTTTDTKIPLYEDPNWADGFDVVVHNECFAHVKDKEFVERILKPHREGTPAVLIHCAMHCYRTGTVDWFEFVGVQSPGHGPHYAYKIENLKPEHAVMSSFGDSWEVPKGELYHTVKLWPTATPLAQARRQKDNEPQTCIWTNRYNEDTRVFCTTVGHYNETMIEPRYLDMLTKGILWAAGRDPETDFRSSDEKTDAEIAALAKAPTNLKPIAEFGHKIPTKGNVAFGKGTSASSEESGKNNFAAKAVDGDLKTRWCANGPAKNEWWQVDLKEPTHIRNLRIHWEFVNAAYQYKIEGSADNENWKTLVDQSQNSKRSPYNQHQVDAPDTRYLKVTFFGSSRNTFGSFWEFEASTGELPKLPKNPRQPDMKSGTLADVQVPDGFQATLFGIPPELSGLRDGRPDR